VYQTIHLPLTHNSLNAGDQVYSYARALMRDPQMDRFAMMLL